MPGHPVDHMSIEPLTFGSPDDEYVHEEDEHVHDYVEEELNDREIAKTVKGDKESTDPNKAEVGKIKEAKDDKE
nr:hypothetical protein [Tanacetum cinerariifolium]